MDLRSLHMGQSIPELIKSRREELYFYSRYNFLREIKQERLIQMEVNRIDQWTNLSNNHKIISIEVENFQIHFYVRFLPWDTDFFLLKTYRLQYVLYDCSFEILTKACEKFNKELRALQAQYVFIEIPSEDIVLVQALTAAGFRLTETRLTYFNNSLNTYNSERFNVRPAKQEDIEELRMVAKIMRNDYDRFHADSVFPKDTADNFLAEYVEQAIRGFCDIVLVPDVPGVKVHSFLTANYNKNEWSDLGCSVSKMVLSAVSSQTNKGWYIKLISEMTYHLKEIGAQAIYMSTQPTNRAVIKTWEKLGYKYGASTHILSYSYKLLK
jgi:dTDP-4-amino-4,6-dideoxy-D-galactose acyltransferase